MIFLPTSVTGTMWHKRKKYDIDATVKLPDKRTTPQSLPIATWIKLTECKTNEPALRQNLRVRSNDMLVDWPAGTVYHPAQLRSLCILFVEMAKVKKKTKVRHANLTNSPGRVFVEQLQIERPRMVKGRNF